MTTVAIVGADGAGKTTIARELERRSSLPLKYLYMGANIESANVALPTSRLMLRWKLASYRRKANRLGVTDPQYVSTHHEAHRSLRYGKVTSALRLANRIGEMWYRLIVASLWQLRGYTVLYDRHFALDAQLLNKPRARLTDRLYHRLAARMSPEPTLVIFLDAPPEVLLARKGEGTKESLARRRAAYLEHGTLIKNFVRVDASRPLPDVVAEAASLIAELSTDPTSRSAGSNRP